MGKATWRGLLCIALLSGIGCSTSQSAVFGLRPEYPAATVDHAKVDSLRPTLRWEAFPRPADLGADSDGWLGRVGDVTYDLRIWRSERDASEERRFPGDLVYSRNGLPASAHRIESGLTPDTKYVWTIRARFELDGKTRVTEWGMLRGLGLRWSGKNENGDLAWVETAHPRSAYIPSWAYYRLRTP